MRFAFAVALAAVAAVSAQPPAGYVNTPCGPRPADCVHELPSGSHIVPLRGGVEVQLKNGSTLWLPELAHCVEDAERLRQQRIARREGRLNATEPRMWLDNVGYYPPNKVGTFQAQYQVPGNPQQMTTQLLYYFIGTENTAVGELSILQPVLSWYQNDWTFASWNCCPSGQTHTSDTIRGIKPNTAGLKGYIEPSGTKWVVGSATSGRTVELTVENNGRVFDWTDVTLEVYYVDQCAQHATGPIIYDQMSMTDAKDQQVTPSWSTYTPTSCNGQMGVSPFRVTIQHN